MDIYDSLTSIVKELKDLFSDKNELKGFDDWDRLIGCIIILEKLVNSFSNLANEPDTEGEDNG